MVSPPIQVFLTTIASQPALRQRQGVFRSAIPRLAVLHSLITNSVEYILRVLQAKNITFSSYDLASDEDAKRLWRRKASPGERYTYCSVCQHPSPNKHFVRVLDKQQLPGILIGGTCPGVSTDVIGSASSKIRMLMLIAPRSPFPTCEHTLQMRVTDASPPRSLLIYP